MKVIRIGRDEANDYLVKHPSVSRFHSEIRIDDDGTIVYIDHSANGTMINGSIVHNAQYNLRGFETIYLAREIALNVSAVMGQSRAKDMPTIIHQAPVYNPPSVVQGGVNPPMNFGQTLGYFFSHYVDFSGRARRSEYWYMVLWNLIFGCIPFVNFIWWLATCIPFMALAVRRLHDVSRSGAWLLISLVPFVGAILLLVWFATDSEYGSNRWGDAPKYN